MQGLSKHLTTWYRHFEEQHPEILLTKVHDFSMDHIKTTLRAKAHETLGLLRFLADQLPGWQAHIHNGEKWAQAAKYLLKLWVSIEKMPVVVPESSQEARVNTIPPNHHHFHGQKGTKDHSRVSQRLLTKYLRRDFPTKILNCFFCVPLIFRNFH